MGLNQFRRDPISGRWTIIVQDKVDMKRLKLNKGSRRSRGRAVETTCKYCEGSETETPPEIFAIRGEDTQKNEPGWAVRVVPEETPMLQIYGDLNNRGLGMYDVLDGIGAHELVIESPHHNTQFADMPVGQIQDILAAYRERFLDLKRDTRFRYVLLHKNFGDAEDRTRDHAHSQIFATPITPTLVKWELMNAMDYYQYKERCVFCDVINQELLDEERVINENEKFLAFAPFASRAPFEMWVLPKRHETFFEWNTDHELLASLLKDLFLRVRNTLGDPNFIMVLHSGPNTAAGKLRGYWKTLERDYHWHIEITPRFRGYTSFEIGSGFLVNLVPPELSARVLREVKLNLEVAA